MESKSGSYPKFMSASEYFDAAKKDILLLPKCSEKAEVLLFFTK